MQSLAGFGLHQAPCITWYEGMNSIYGVPGQAFSWKAMYEVEFFMAVSPQMPWRVGLALARRVFMHGLAFCCKIEA